MSSRYQFHSYEAGDPGLPTILFLHGFMGNAEDWGDIMSSMSDRWHCLALDLPGHGNTSVIDADADFSMESTAAGIVEYLDARQINNCHLVGYSMGGRLALFLARNYPNQFDRCVFESASPGLATVAERQQRVAHDEALARDLERKPYDRFIYEWYTQPLFAGMKKVIERFDKLIQRRLRLANPKGFARSLREIGTGAQPSLWSELGKITTPVLLIAGEKDGKFQQIATKIAAEMTLAIVTRIVEAGHNVHFECPEAFIAAIHSFFETDTEVIND